MPLNYNKWDNLQLSDDSDIEVHPNVDKKSMIRWKQRDIHEKRAINKQKLLSFPLEEAQNARLISRIDDLLSSTKAQGQTFIAHEILRLKGSLPYKYEEKKYNDKGVDSEGKPPSENHMIVSLLMQVVGGVQKKEEEAGKKNGAEDRTEALIKELEWHRQRLVDRQEEIKKEKVEIEKEQAKYITSDDLKMGWDSKTIVSSTPTAQPTEFKASGSSSKPAKKTEQVIETLNSPAVAAAKAKEAAELSEGDSSDEADVPPLTPSALAFSRIAPLDWPTTMQAISSDPSLLTEETGDALMVEAFSQAMKGTKEGERRAMECIQKALVGQYCRSLGKDGVMLFFQRMTNQNHQALKIFLDDVSTTSTRVIERAKVVAAERSSKKVDEATEGVEQIQLVASDPSTIISFEIPDGPPPEKLEITGEGSEELDPVLVREFLQRRWDIFEAFPKNLKKALEEKSLEKVNKVLGKMAVDEAEEVVTKLQEAGILSFETPGVIDQTGRAPSSANDETVSIPLPESTDSTSLPPPVPVVGEQQQQKQEDSDGLD
ncbi:hypothetical protein JCM8547_005558 [Rhodosporidiobolus lusitaniae]